MSTNDEEVKHIDAAIAALRDPTIPPAQAAEIIAASCERRIRSYTARGEPPGIDGDTPGLEIFGWGFFGRAINLAIENPSTYQRISAVFRQLKAIRRHGCEGWSYWGKDWHWENLPLFGPSAREGLYIYVQRLPSGEDLPTDTAEAWRLLSTDAIPDPSDAKAVAYTNARTRWINQYRFFIHLWAEGVFDFSLYALAAMCRGLEILDLDQPEKPGPDTPRALAIETAAAVIEEAPETIYKCRTTFPSDDDTEEEEETDVPGADRERFRWEGVRGFHPDRWVLWKDIFKEVIENKGKYKVPEHIVDTTKRALVIMEKTEAVKPCI